MSSEPPLEVVPDEPESPFEALLRNARTDPEAATGLALAYADMSEEARDKLVPLLREERPELLALLLGVEESPAIAERIAEALGEGDGPAPVGADSGHAWGREDDGGVALIRHLHGEFVEAVSVSWAAAEVSVETVPLASARELDALRRRLGVPAEARALSLAHATDLLAEGLWRLRRRRGSLPDSLHSVAALLDPRA